LPEFLKQAVTELKGVGPKMAANLEKIGIEKVQDLLFHLPLRYQDRTRVYPIGSTQHGQELVIVGKVEHTQIIFKHRRMMTCTVSDGSGMITLRFFHFANVQKDALTHGVRVRCFGEVRVGHSTREMVHPEYKIIEEGDPIVLSDALTPIYPTTKGLQQRSLLRLVSEALSKSDVLDDLIPSEISKEYNLSDLKPALQMLHKPPSDLSAEQLLERTHPSQQRLIFEELLAHHLSLRKLREQQKQTLGIPLESKLQYFDKLLKALPFELTNAQKRVISEINHDLKQNWPMSRLVQGDVGSGKTLVAAAAALTAIEAGYQVAIMAPTEILAEQHLEAFNEWLLPLEINVAWLNGRMKVAERREMMAQIETGAAKVIIGTHALFQEAVTFHNLGFVIIDEQHRFGVHQRLSLHEKNRDKSIHTHQLIMTATPIPRTLAMTAYGDLDLSVIDELPPGRKPIETAVLSNEKRFEVMEHLYAKCQQGMQAYWVCPLIEESELLHAQAAEVTASLFSEHWPDLRVGLIHGRLKGAQKAQVMSAFKQHQLDLLVATTVIEVGVNVPNASLMIIENAERLGLAQLHQLRGRVGRGSKQSHCVLLYQAPLSQTGKARLNIMRETTDGFRIAEEDLKIRGPGEVLGTKQTGGLEFKIADLKRDAQWVPIANEWASTMLKQYPKQIDALKARWMGQKIDYQHA